MCRHVHVCASICVYTFFYRQLDFSSQPGVANEFCENEAENCLVVAYFCSYAVIINKVFFKKIQYEAAQLLMSCLIFGQNLRLKAKQPSCL